MTAEKPKSADQIKELEQFLPEATQEELAEILAYGEKIKAEGERKKKDFWATHCMNIHYRIDWMKEDFMKLLRYRQQHKEELECKYKYINKMYGLEREKFIKEYLYNDILYSGELDNQGLDRKVISNWEIGKSINNGEILLCDGRGYNKIKTIVENLELKEGIELHFKSNNIGDEGAKFISENIKLKDGMTLNLTYNQIGDEGIKAISHMELKEGVILILNQNLFGDEGVNDIIRNLKLKENVVLDLRGNNISNEMKQKLEEWEKSYHDKEIYCEIWF